VLDGVEDMLLDGVDEVLDGGEALLADDWSDELLEPDGLDDELLLDGVDDVLLDGVADVSLDMDELDAAPPLTPSAPRVFASSWPDAPRLFCCWNCLIAASVFGPILPSTLTSAPLSFSACWAWRMSELPLVCADEEALDCASLSDAWEALSLAAMTAVLDSANAAITACASFMCVVLSGTVGTGSKDVRHPTR
jgi:hypothetical protein